MILHTTRCRILILNCTNSLCLISKEAMGEKGHKSFKIRDFQYFIESIPRIDVILAISLGLTIFGFIILQFCHFFIK